MKFTTELRSARFALNCVEGDAKALTNLFPGMTERAATEALNLHRFGRLDIYGTTITIPDHRCGPPINAKKPDAGTDCTECVRGMPIYVPCGKPAEFIIANRDERDPMCMPCADHNVRNRGAHYVTEDVQS